MQYTTPWLREMTWCTARYATYAEPDMRRPLRFADIPGRQEHGPRGSTLGGTGIGISSRCRIPDAALAYVRFLAELATQNAFAYHHGQPALKDAWEDDAINQRFSGCFRATRATIDRAWIRPRYRAYLKFQAAGGTLIERFLRERTRAESLLDQLSHLHASRGSGDQ